MRDNRDERLFDEEVNYFFRFVIFWSIFGSKIEFLNRRILDSKIQKAKKSILPHWTILYILE